MKIAQDLLVIYGILGFGGTLVGRGTLVEKHCTRLTIFVARKNRD
jgi:hypothetical protein